MGGDQEESAEVSCLNPPRAGGATVVVGYKMLLGHRGLPKWERSFWSRSRLFLHRGVPAD